MAIGRAVLYLVQEFIVGILRFAMRHLIKSHVTLFNTMILSLQQKYSADIKFLHYMRGQLGHNTRPHAQLPPSFLGMDAWMTSQLNLALIRKLRETLMC